MVKVAVLGYGTIGSGVVQVLNTSKDIVTRNAGTEVEVKYVLDLRDFPGDPVEEILVHDYARIVNDPEVDIVVEVMGGTHPAYEFVKDALLKGKNVCTSNKALVAEFGPELVRIAREKSVNFLFEASVGGGIPIIRPILRSLTVDTFYEITGILNGTTNYILTKMYDEGGSFEEALKEAQALGYAEADPSADVDGYDAARKIAILSGLMYGKNLDFEQLSIEGIRNISKIDMDYAKFLGKKIKLLGITYNINGEIYTEVAPHMIIIDEAKHLHTNIPILWSDEPVVLAERGRHKSKFFVRVDRDCNAIKNTFDLEQLVTLPDYQDEYAVVTAEMTFAEFYEKIGNKEHVRSIVQVK